MEEKDNISKSLGIVRGNVLRVSIALEVEVRTENNGKIEVVRTELVPLDGKVRVVLRDGGNKYTYDVTAVGNVASFEDLGQLGAGIYDIEVLCRNSKNEPMRYMARDVIIVNDATADADIEPGVEFDGQTVQLEAAVFLADGGGSGEAVQSDWEETDTSAPAFIKNKPTIPVVPTKVSAFENDAHYLTEHQDISGKVDKEVGKGLSTNDFTAALKAKLESLDPYTKAEVNAAIQQALSEYTPGETVVASVDDIDIVDNPNGQNADTILAAASARMVKEIYINVKALFQNLAGMAFVGDKPDWVSVPVRTYTIGMASADSNITLTDGNGNAVTSPQPEGTPLTLRLSVANGYRFAAAPTALMGNTNIEFTLDGSYYVAEIGALSGNIVITASSVEMGTYSVNIPTGAVFCTSAGASASAPSIEEGEGVTCYIKPADGRRWAESPRSTGATVTVQSGSIYKIVASNVQADINVSGSTEAIPTYNISAPSDANITVDNGSGGSIPASVLEGTALTIRLTPAANYSINVSSAKMGQQDLTPTNVNGVLTFTIASVTGAVVITAVAVEVVARAVRNHLLNMSTSNNAAQVEDGDSYTADITANSGCTSNDDLCVMIDGDDVTSQCAITDITGGKRLSIPASAVTADIDIIASASTGKITVKAAAGGDVVVKIADHYGNGNEQYTVSAGTSMEITPNYTGRITFEPKANLEEIDYGGVLFTNGYYSSLDGCSGVKRATGIVRNSNILCDGTNAMEYIDVSHIRPYCSFKNMGSGLVDAFTVVDGMAAMNTSEKTSFEGLFQGSRIQEVVINNMSAATSMKNMFSGSKVRRVILRKGASGVTTWSNAFSSCANIEYIDISELNITSALTEISFAFSGAKSGITMKIGGFDLSGVTSSTVHGMNKITTLICTTSVPQNSALLTYMTGLTNIYVPNDAVNAYKEAWSAMANNIHPVSEYTE